MPAQAEAAGVRARHPLRALASGLLVVVGCAGEPSPSFAAIGDSAVGCLEIGAPREAVERACGSVTDTTIHLEGMVQQAAWVAVGQGRALAEMVDGVVWRIRVDDPALATADSIRVGTAARRLAGLPGVRVLHGEGTFVRTDAHCGKSFQIQGLPSAPGEWSGEDLAALPDSVLVVRILVLGGCATPEI